MSGRLDGRGIRAREGALGDQWGDVSRGEWWGT